MEKNKPSAQKLRFSFSTTMLAEAKPGVTRKRLIVEYEEYWELNYTVLKIVWSILAIKVGLCSVKTASTI